MASKKQNFLQENWYNKLMHDNTKKNPMQEKIIHSTQKIIIWNFSGSTLFEIAKTAHHIALFFSVTPSFYGAIGGTFSMIYIIVTIANLESGNSLVPHLNTISNIPWTVHHFITIPQATIMTIVGGLLHATLTKSLFIPRNYYLLVLAITITEGLRKPLHTLLHALGHNKEIIIAELSTASFFFISFWSYHLITQKSITFNTIFFPYALQSIATLALFYRLIHLHIQPPSITKHKPPTWHTIIKTRAYLTTLYLPKQLFSGNFLTPFFALSKGIVTAGIIKFACELALSIKTILTATIGFSSSALFLRYPRKIKESFAILWQTINSFTVCILITTLFLIPLLSSTNKVPLILLIVCFSLIHVFDYLFIIYEKLFLVAKKISVITRYRAIEMAVGIAWITIHSHHPVIALAGLIAIKGLSFFYTVKHAHKTWHLHPHAKISFPAFLYAITAGIVSYGAMYTLKKNYTHRMQKISSKSSARPATPFLRNT